MPARDPKVARIGARTSRIVAYGRRSARIPGISPGLRRPRVGRRRAAFDSRPTPPRSIFGARLRKRVPQYGHSVTYGDTSEPHFLQTTKRSGPLAMGPRFYAGPVASTISRITSA